MLHYHGLPITPETAAATVIRGGHAFVPATARQLTLAVEFAQSFALDNGAFTAWRTGAPITDWGPYYEFVKEASRFPGFDFAVIPDVIDGSEEDNDALINACPIRRWANAVPVWHMHESLERLRQLVFNWPRVALGSSGEFASIGTTAWWVRMAEAMAVACDKDGAPLTRLHGLRMLDPHIFSRLPFSSADSTNIARNIGMDNAWRGTYTPATRESRALVMRQRIESVNSAPRWDPACLQRLHLGQGELAW